MKKIGFHTVIWGVFLFTVFVAVFIGYNVINDNGMSNFMKIAIIIVGILISAIQFALSRTNSTGRINFITNRLSKVSLYNQK